LTIGFAGKAVLSALTIAVFLPPLTTNAQSAKPQLEQRQSPVANQQSATKEAVASSSSATNSEKRDEEKVTPAVEAVLPHAVVPPPPNVLKRNPKAISIPAEALDKDSDYQEQPVAGVSIGSRFGVRRDPFTRRSKFHSGVDIKARWGDPVGASYPGTVSFVGWSHGYGNMVVVDHGGGIATHYAHLSSFDVEVGEHVERGTILGRAGSTGRATSPHLHYEVRVDGSAVNPFSTLTLDPESAYFKQTRTQTPDKPTSSEEDSTKASATSAPPASPLKLKEQR
jgi:murein DD-endopeptidase MepM/ murein hydrolase activator NlpD